MKPIKRFCFSKSVAQGTHIIGYLNLLEIVFLVALYTIVGAYTYIPLIILPILCLHYFFRMVRKDGTKSRRLNYRMFLISSIIISCFQVSQLTAAIALPNRKECQYTIYCTIGKTPVFQICVAALTIRILWQIYCCLVLRQHIKNRVDGMGDALLRRTGEIPGYLQAQQDWVQELHQDQEQRSSRCGPEMMNQFRVGQLSTDECLLASETTRFSEVQDPAFFYEKISDPKKQPYMNGTTEKNLQMKSQQYNGNVA